MGYVIINGERRFIPLPAGRKRVRHCTSCRYFLKPNYCTYEQAFTNPYAEECEAYENRTWRKTYAYT